MKVDQGMSGLSLADVDDGDVFSFGPGPGPDLAMKLNAGELGVEAEREGRALCVWVKTGVVFSRPVGVAAYVYPHATCFLEPD